MAFPEYVKQKAVELSRGRSAGEVRRALEKAFPKEYLPDERTIRRWRKAKQVFHIDEEQESIRSSVTENWKEHNAKLAGVANRLLDNDLNRVMKWVNRKGQDEYHLFDKNEEHLQDRLTEDDLAGKFEQNIILAYRDYTEWFFKNCFLPHLYAEWPEEFKNRGFYIVAEEQPYQLVETLRILAERKTFKGTCPVCKDW